MHKLTLFGALLPVMLLSTAASPKYRYETVIATSYCPCSECCGSHSPGITATGTSAHNPGVAVDPEFIPHGSRLDIPSYGNWVLADDTGGAIRGNRIDLRMKTHQEAITFGIRKLKIRVWEQ